MILFCFYFKGLNFFKTRNIVNFCMKFIWKFHEIRWFYANQWTTLQFMTNVLFPHFKYYMHYTSCICFNIILTLFWIKCNFCFYLLQWNFPKSARNAKIYWNDHHIYIQYSWLWWWIWKLENVKYIILCIRYFASIRAKF